ncbi:MAG TPA: sigma 54-interacting transcriptional regulator [Syntrophomonas sp.]|nr:sigma 54-interacting transcriptional regulator [Syntrophomonas sp.]
MNSNSQDDRLNTPALVQNTITIKLPYAILGNDQRLIFANSSYRKQLGIADETDIKDAVLTDYIPPPVFDRILQCVGNTSPRSPVAIVSLSDIPGQGKIIWAIISQYDGSGNLQCWHLLGINFDMVHVNDPTSLFYQLIEKLPINIYTLSKSGYVYINQQQYKSLGYTPEEMYRTGFLEYIVPEKQHITAERMRRLWNNEPVPPSYEIDVIKKNQEIITMQIFHIPFEYEGGKVILSAAIDITPRKKAEADLIKLKEELEERVRIRTEELELTNRQMTQIIETISDGIVFFSTESGMVLTNAAMKKMLGDNLDGFIDNLNQTIFSYKDERIETLVRDGIPFQDAEMRFTANKTKLCFMVSGSVASSRDKNAIMLLFIFKPLQAVHSLVNRLSGARAEIEFEDIYSKNPAMLKLVEDAKAAATSESTVLVLGESGTGKEMFAQAIHNFSPRRNGPFVAINCGVIPRELIGSELFGYESGSFTGAKASGKPGKFEFASGGTLFLDEIGDMPLEQQIALLRVLQEKTIMRIGSNISIPVDVRIICATHKDLYHQAMTGNFRMDLFYRINVISLNIPPLRKRPEDIGLLFDVFLKKHTGNHEAKNISPMVYQILQQYNWPGNVREIQNLTERLVHIDNDGIIDLNDIPQEIIGTMSTKLQRREQPMPALSEEIVDKDQLNKILSREEKERLVNLMLKHKQNITKVAADMGVSRTTVYKKLKKHGLT